MRKPVNFSRDNVAVKWKNVKRNLSDMGIGTTDKFEADAHRAIRNILQRGIDEEAAAKIGAKKYERNKERRAYRKGSYRRDLTTTFGRSEVEMPRVRGKRHKKRDKHGISLCQMAMVLYP